MFLDGQFWRRAYTSLATLILHGVEFLHVGACHSCAKCMFPLLGGPGVFCFLSDGFVIALSSGES